MPLPNAENACVPLSKITRYLLSETHSVGRAKARFFRALGFNERHPELLQEALLEVAREGLVRGILETPYGSKYVVDGQLRTPKGELVWIRTIWIVEAGQDQPRLVTAYPRGEE